MNRLDMTKYLGIALLGISLLSGCGAEGDQVGNANADRSLSAVESMSTCEDIKNSLNDAPIDALVEQLKGMADSGIACAQYGLGSLYIWGYQHIEADGELAKAYLGAASLQGHKHATALLDYHFNESR